MIIVVYRGGKWHGKSIERLNFNEWSNLSEFVDGAESVIFCKALCELIDIEVDEIEMID